MTLISADENKHVSFLRAALGSQAVPALVEGTAPGNLDFSGSKGGTRAALFPTVFSSFPTFLAVGQSLEDTGVRAYKGAAPALLANKVLLEAALNIHSVEARHASRLRSLRRGTTGPGPTVPITPTPKSWVSGDEGGGAAPPTTAPIYGPGTPAASFPGEANVTQGGMSLTGIPALAALNLPAAAFSEAFDEPLDTATVANIALTFIVGNTF
ncbi:ferritin-like domain-containing protein [Hymenobacter glacialis]|uniref:ferritin-like domain-containing protein n=1 Tax=Hymenobacter glacialis TaxID=1908236 RepID=UPI000B8E61A3|nr:ferritin-like domain-containing protein [Hymenobacter glacialis]